MRTEHTYIIAEAGVNHNGDIDLAKRLIDMAADCGADAIKFQTFKAEETTSVYAEKAEYQKETTDDDSQLEMIRKLELPFEAFGELKDYCTRRKIDFISTPDGELSLRCLVDLNLPVIKVGSTEVTNISFLNQIAKTGKKIILSTGMSTLGEVEQAVCTILDAGNSNLSLMHCTTSYPTKICDVNLKAMVTMRDAFKLPVGYSDHTVSNEAAIAAVTLGATCIEKHITLDNMMPGPDHKASMNPEDFKKYVVAIRNTELLLGDGIKKPTSSELEIMKTVRRSILASRDLKKGTVITKDMLCLKRPGDGIEPKFMDVVLGMTLLRDVNKEQKIMWSDLKE